LRRQGSRAFHALQFDAQFAGAFVGDVQDDRNHQRNRGMFAGHNDVKARQRGVGRGDVLNALNVVGVLS
jgi:hypothetical protein